MRIANVAGLQIVSGRSCGSGFLLGLRNGRGYVGTNAHVVGTTTGTTHEVRGVMDSGEVLVVRGRLIAAGFRSGSAIDWAVLELSASDYLRLPGSDDNRQLADLLAGVPVVYAGGPRCELPSARRLAFRSVRGAIAYGTPAAIPGMSGGAWQQDGRAVAITTWTDGTHNLAQTGQALRATMRPEFFTAAKRTDGLPGECVSFGDLEAMGGYLPEDFVLPKNAVPACEHPQACEDGYHSDGLQPVMSLIAGDDDDDAAALLREVASGFDWITLLEILLPILMEALRSRRR